MDFFRLDNPVRSSTPGPGSYKQQTTIMGSVGVYGSSKNRSSGCSKINPLSKSRSVQHMYTNVGPGTHHASATINSLGS